MKYEEDYIMPHRNRVSTSDSQALDRQTEQLEKAKAMQTLMRDVNAYWRKHNTCIGAPHITEAQAKKLDDKIATTRYSWERQPFSSYDLTNNNAAIKRWESKVKEVSKGYAGWDFNGGRAVANTEADRLQLFFDAKPDEPQRTALKSHGFKWAPSQEAWQRQLTGNAIYAAGRLDFIKPLDGRSVFDHQPKAPVRDEGAR
jgi:hypothetical protein